MFQNGNTKKENPSHVVSWIIFISRFNALPEVGQNRGLDLILDAHTNLVMKSSVVNTFQVKSTIYTSWIVKHDLRLDNLYNYFFVLFWSLSTCWNTRNVQVLTVTSKKVPKWTNDPWKLNTTKLRSIQNYCAFRDFKHSLTPVWNSLWLPEEV